MREISIVCSLMHTKRINTLCGQNVELLNDKLAVHIVTTGLKGFNLSYKSSRWKLYSEISVVCSLIHTKYINTLCGQNVELLNVKLVVHIVTTGLKGLNLSYKSSRWMLYSEISVVCSLIHTKYINTLCGQNVEFLNVKSGGTYSDHRILMYLRSGITYR